MECGVASEHGTGASVGVGEVAAAVAAAVGTHSPKARELEGRATRAAAYAAV